MQVRCATELTLNSSSIMCAIAAVWPKFPPPPAEQVTLMKSGASSQRAPAASRARSSVSSPLGGNISNETGVRPAVFAWAKMSSMRMAYLQDMWERERRRCRALGSAIVSCDDTVRRPTCQAWSHPVTRRPVSRWKSRRELACAHSGRRDYTPFPSRIFQGEAGGAPRVRMTSPARCHVVRVTVRALGQPRRRRPWHLRWRRRQARHRYGNHRR